MAAQVHEVYQAGLELDLEARAVVAHGLLASVRHDVVSAQPEVEAAWLDEIGSRVKEILDGRVTLVTADESRRRVHELLASLGQ